MKKIKITERQHLLLKSLKENEESGVKSIGAALGDVIIRIVVSGDMVPKMKDRIIQLIQRQDKEAKVGFFEATNKIVGNVKEVKLDGIKRDIKALDASINVEKKPITKSLKEETKKKYKITKEQYNRLFADKLLQESTVTGGLNRVDKTFKKEFAGKDVQNLKPVSEDKFNITKPNKSVPKMSPINEESNQLDNEVIELIKYLYRKNEELSSFWSEHGITYDEICDTLLEKGIIIKKDGGYEISKSLGSPEEAIKKLKDTVSELIGNVQPETEPEMEMEASNVPAGSDNDPDAPWNQDDEETTSAKTPEKIELKVIAYNGEIAICEGPDGSLYVFYYGNIKHDDFFEYASVTRKYVGRDEEGGPEYDYDKNYDIDGDVLTNYLNDNLEILSKGEGIKGFENGDDVVKIDEPLKQELTSLYDKNKSIIKALGPIEEAEFPELMNSLKKNIEQAATKKPSNETPEAKQSRILKKLAQLKAQEKERQREAGEIEEITASASSGAFTAPMTTDTVKKELPETPVIDETTTVSAGNYQYDAPALANVTRDGQFKKGPKTKAQVKTQYAGGSFVKTGDKINDIAQIKTKSSVITPSLDENTIYEMVAKESGRSIDEVKRIIESKRLKGKIL